ncbi:MAG: PEP-CTERM sorting domain-containing protein [Alphaproteobacteria bacterium]|nr:PEP-CTERM sorting domain-containing protein [Alphaproteobacteria bacterium]
MISKYRYCGGVFKPHGLPGAAMFRKLIGACVGLAMMGMAGTANAVPISIGSFTFDQTAFADAVGTTTGTITTFVTVAPATFPTNTISIDAALTGSDLNSGVFCDEPCTIELLFTDNTVVNRVGTDLILFEQGTAESTLVTIGEIELLISSSANLDGLEDLSGALINISEIELDDFGIASGGLISSVIIDLNFPIGADPDTFPSSDPLVLAALNSIPEPSTLALFATGLALLAFLGWRRRGAA